MTAALTLAFSAGMVATLNPCGFAMLPAYLSYFMGLQDEGKSTGAAVRSAFAVGGIVSAGFLLVFGIAGVVITAGFRSVIDWIPWLALVIGVAVTILGIAMLRGYELTVGLPKAKKAGKGRGYGNVFGFGVSYAVASLSCTLPVFLTVVATQLTQRSFASGLVIFLAYAVGMSIVLLGITIVMALGKQSLVNKLRASARYINRISGAILVLAGVFIVWFWTTEITSGAGALGESSAFQFVESLSAKTLNFVADYTELVAGGFAVLIASAALFAWRSRSTKRDDDDEHGHDKIGPLGKGPEDQAEPLEAAHAGASS
jgi:cytochrome c biogenesis protein CcdA